MTTGPAFEWARLDGQTVVVASPERAWLHTCSPFDVHDPFAGAMHGFGGVATTRRLLDGAIGAGLKAARRDGAIPTLTERRWIGRLVGYYHLTTHTPTLMREAARRFAEAGRTQLAEWAREKADEEDNHDRLALKDLADLGIDGAGIVGAWIPETAGAMVARFKESVADPLPLDCVAYAHVVERLAAAQGAGTIAKVRAVLPDGSRAWRSLRVHSGIGSDAGHVDENVRLIATLGASERARIALACRSITGILSSAPTSGYLDEVALENRIAPWRLQGVTNARLDD